MEQLRPAVSFSKVLAALILASTASIMSTDLIAPSLPDLPKLLGATAEQAQLVITVSVVAFALAQLVFGPLSERYGRRPVFLAGMLGFTAFSYACSVAEDIQTLLLLRVGQGITAAVEAVVGLAIIQDLFDERNRVRALAVFGLVLSLGPAVAPILGGYVHVLVGWRANFVLTAIIAAAATVLVWRWVPESTQPDRSALQPRQLLRDYATLLGSIGYLRLTLVESAGLGAIFAFVTAGPFILVERHGVAIEHFGLYQAALVVGYGVASLLAERTAGRLRPTTMLSIGVSFGAAGAAALLLVVFGGGESPLTLTASMVLITFGTGLVWAVAPTLAMSATAARTGAAAALLAAIEFGIAGLASASVVALHDGSARPLAVTVGALIGLTAIFYLLAPARAAAMRTG